MFPIRDHNPSGRRPYVTMALVAVNIAVFLAYWLSLRDEVALGWFFYNWGLVPDRVMSGDGLPTLVTSMFLHGGWMHLAGNMLFLWIFGDNLEDAMGHLGFGVFYLASGLCAAALQIGMDPASGVPMVGASGAIAGVMGGYLLLFPKAKVDVLIIFVIFFRVFAIPAWIVLGFWFGVQFLNGANAAADGVAYMAHVGGFVGGVVLTLPAWLRRGGFAFWQRTHGQPPHPEADYPLRKTSIPRVPRR
jgi:membrane associated rhomboid family serine protease